MGNRAREMKKVFATLRALLDVLENLVGQSPTDRLHRQILEEVIHGRTHDPVKKNVIFVCGCITGALKPCDSNSICFTRINLHYIKRTITLLILLFFQIKKIKRSDAALRGELMPYNIVPLDAPSSVANIIGFFPEV
jgi:hypothetical protein